ncbi:hypothetical protein B0H10DRAFT_2124802 [Mycena sp. CBHHK59/15]|nr:hypothetical protein B0H10DRAFT_2124802 [Mycena sp. CBHHK59/15]
MSPLVADATLSHHALRSQLAKLETLLGDIDSAVLGRRALVQERAAVQARLDAIVYPVLTLPPEVVSEIFIYCLCDSRARPSFAVAPLLLCNICSVWRTIAVLTPALWSSVELTFKYSLFGTSLIDLLEVWLSRTGSYPLSFSLWYDEYTVSKRRPEMNLLVQVLMRHSSQWEDVELRLPDPSEFHQFKGYFPSLKRIVLEHAVSPSNPPVISFMDAPGLASVQLSLGCALDPIVFPWSQLTTVKCEYLRVDDCLRLLRQTTRIVDLTVYLKEGGSQIEHAPFSLPSLRSLHLLREECHMDLLQHLTLPALETLSISFENEDITRFLSFLSRSSCPLQQIIFDAWPFDQVELVKCFEAMPSLQELKLWRPQYFTDSFLLQLADPTALLPNLKALELNHVYPIQFTMPALASMLSSRWHSPIRLESFRTVLHKGSTETDPESLFRLQLLVAAGMKIHVDYH